MRLKIKNFPKISSPQRFLWQMANTTEHSYSFYFLPNPNAEQSRSKSNISVIPSVLFLWQSEESWKKNLRETILSFTVNISLRYFSQKSKGKIRNEKVNKICKFTAKNVIHNLSFVVLRCHSIHFIFYIFNFIFLNF